MYMLSDKMACLNRFGIWVQLELERVGGVRREVSKMTAASGLFLIPTAARASLIQHPKFYLEWKDKTFSSISSTFAASSRTRNRRRVSVSTHFCCNSLLSDLAPATSAAYGALLLGGGVFAYTRSGSKGSLFGGFTGAALMATAYLLMQVPKTKDIGDALGFGSAFLFSSVFGIRLAATRKLVPSGLLLGLSIFALTVFISAYLQDLSDPLRVS